MGEPVEVLESSAAEINRLFPKCGRRNITNFSDLNRNCVSDDNDNYELPLCTTTIEEEVTSLESSASSTSHMSIDSATPLSTPASHSSNGGPLERDTDLSVVSAYSRDERFPSVLDSSYEEGPASPTSHSLLPKRDHFRLRDSRIEAAGGREVFSQSRSRQSRRRQEETRRAHHHYHHSHFSEQQQQQHDARTQQQTAHQLSRNSHRESSSSRSNSTSSNSSSASRSSESRDPPGVESYQKGIKNASSTLVYETCLSGSTEVVFDDISDWVVRGLTVREFDNQETKEEKGTKPFIPIPVTSPTPPSCSPSHTDQESDYPEDGESPARVTKIGNVPIAKYEGSPRRYGQSQRPARPGFPRRVMDSEERSRSKMAKKSPDSSKDKMRIHMLHEANVHEPQIHSSNSYKSKLLLDVPDIEFNPQDLNLLDNPGERSEQTAAECKTDNESDESLPTISTLTSTYGSTFSPSNSKELFESTTLPDIYESYGFEDSETRKVLEEFFLDSGKKTKQEFFDLEYTLKRQHGNSYVGQRLAECEEEVKNDELNLVQQLYLVDHPHLNEYLPESSSHSSHHNFIVKKSEEPIIENGNAKESNEVSQVSTNLSPNCETSLSHHHFFEHSLDCVNLIDDGSFAHLPIITDTSPSLIVDEKLIDMSMEYQNNNHSEEKSISCNLEEVFGDKSTSSLNHAMDDYEEANETHDADFDSAPLPSVSLSKDSDSATVNDDEPKDDQNNSLSDVHENTTEDDGQAFEIRDNIQLVSRNFTLSPETTSCDSLDVESEFSVGDAEGSLHSSGKLVSTMPVLEDGLSSGEESDIELSPDALRTRFKVASDKDRTSIMTQQMSLKQQHHLPKQETQQLQLFDSQQQYENEEINDGDIDDAGRSLHRGKSFDDQLCRGEMPIMTLVDQIAAFGPLIVPPGEDDYVGGLCSQLDSPHADCHQSPSSSTLTLMKKQISEIEREIALNKPESVPLRRIGPEGETLPPDLDLQLLDPLNEKVGEPPPPPAPHPHRNSNEVLENGSSTPGQATSPSAVIGHLHSPQFTPVSAPLSGPQLLSSLGSLTSPIEIIPHMVTGHPATHDLQHKQGNSISPSRESVEAAIADIKQAIRLTKNLPLKAHPQLQERLDKGPVWVPRSNRRDQPPQSCSQNSSPTSPGQHSDQRTPPPLGQTLMQLQESSPSGASSRSRDRSLHEEEDGDTDQETDRLLGQQRSDDPGFLDEKDKETNKKKGRSKEVLIEGVLFRARYLGSTQLTSEGQPTKTTRMMQAEEAVSRIKAPEGEAQPSTEVDLFISTEKIMVLNTDLKEIMMDHALRTISYIADIGDLVVLMARRRVLPTDDQAGNPAHRIPKMICHVFESDEAQFIAQSIGQAFQVAYLEFLKANGIEDHSFVKEMDYQEVLNSQEIFGDELQMFAKKELQKEVVVPKMKGEILGVVVVESGWGSMVPTVVIANLSPAGAAAKCGQLNIGDQIIAINGVSLVGLPLSNCQNYIKNTKYNTAVKLTVVPCPPVVEVKIRRPDTKYQLGFSVQNGVICSLLRGGIAERGGVRVGHRIIDINSQSVVAVPHEKIVNLLATSVGEIRMKTMPTSIFRLLTGQESPQFI